MEEGVNNQKRRGTNPSKWDRNGNSIVHSLSTSRACFINWALSLQRWERAQRVRGKETGKKAGGGEAAST